MGQHQAGHADALKGFDKAKYGNGETVLTEMFLSLFDG